MIIFISCGNEKQITGSSDIKTSGPYFKLHFDPEEPGCGGCHNDQRQQDHLLSSKANEKWEDHNFDITGKLLTINDCLLCHSVDNRGFEGAIAPTPLRTIVHKVHSAYSGFSGDCFTCHTIMGDSSPDLFNYKD